MKNPWKNIALDDYENHMKLKTVYQLQTMNQIMKKQFYQYSISSLMILGIAGGNGLEHIQPHQFKKIIGIDINPDYLKECQKRYPHLDEELKLLCVDLTHFPLTLPHTDLVISNLLIEYIGYDCFQKVIQTVNPQYISCLIQINTDETFVSDSPYIHVFDNLDNVLHSIEQTALINKLKEIHYSCILQEENALPNGKTFLRLDFQKKK